MILLRDSQTANEENMLDSTGKRLAMLQNELGYNNKDVVEYLKGYGIEIDPSHYSRLVNDKALPSVQVLRALAQVLEATTDYILVMPGADDPARIPAPDAFMTEDANRVGAMVDRMDEDMRKLMIDMVSEMLRLNEERRELHAEIAELLEEQITLLSGQKRQKVESLLGRLSLE